MMDIWVREMRRKMNMKVPGKVCDKCGHGMIMHEKIWWNGYPVCSVKDCDCILERKESEIELFKRLMNGKL